MSEVCVGAGADLTCFYKETASDLVFFLPESRNTNDYPALTDPTPQSQGECGSLVWDDFYKTGKLGITEI